MVYRTILLVCCVAAAILMIAIFYNAVTALIEREISQLDAVWLLHGSLMAAALFLLFGVLEQDEDVPSIVDPAAVPRIRRQAA
jgi:steroid 5-alpha reductase family enzyme